jgi:predicted transcriptional regulator
MDIIDLFTGTKWDILSGLSKQKQSPLELANKLNTTIANISQQLRLLEAAGLVKTEKTRAAEKGKPRVLYSLAKDFVFVISLQSGSADKKLIEANIYHNIISRIWLLKNTDLHQEIEKVFWKIESILEDISAIAIDEISNTIYIASKKEKKIEDAKIKVKFVSDIKESEVVFIYKKMEVVK